MAAIHIWQHFFAFVLIIAVYNRAINFSSASASFRVRSKVLADPVLFVFFGTFVSFLIESAFI